MAIVLAGKQLGTRAWDKVEKKADAVLTLHKNFYGESIDCEPIERYISDYNSPFCGGHAEVYTTTCFDGSVKIAVCGSVPVAVVPIHRAICKYTRNCVVDWNGKATTQVLADEASDYEVRLDLENDIWVQDIVNSFIVDKNLDKCVMALNKSRDVTLSRVQAYMNMYFNKHKIVVKDICVFKNKVWLSIGSLGTVPCRFNEEYCDYILSLAQNAMQRWHRTDWVGGRSCSLPASERALSLVSMRNPQQVNDHRWSTSPCTLLHFKSKTGDIYSFAPVRRIPPVKKPKSKTMSKDQRDSLHKSLIPETKR